MSSVLGGTLGFGVKKADIPGLQQHLLDLDPHADPLTEEFWETVCLQSFHTNLVNENVVTLILCYSCLTARWISRGSRS